MLIILLTFIGLNASERFDIVITRTQLSDKLLQGPITLNGMNLGLAYENQDYRIKPGKYKGLIWYSSDRNFVQGPGGLMTKGRRSSSDFEINKGDFLINIDNVCGMEGILLHGGNKPQHSEGCVLLGPVSKGKGDLGILDKNHPLYKLRQAFYKTDNPVSSPDVHITIEIIDKVNKKPRPCIDGIWKSSSGNTEIIIEHQVGKFYSVHGSTWKKALDAGLIKVGSVYYDNIRPVKHHPGNWEVNVAWLQSLGDVPQKITWSVNSKLSISEDDQTLIVVSTSPLTAREETSRWSRVK